MKKLILALAAFAGLIMPAALPAQNAAMIAEAKRAGLIGERFDGYMGIVTASPSDELRRQVSAVNIRRRSLYSGLASRKGVTPEEVGITAACTLFRRIGVGEFYLPGQGGWRRVVAGQSPLPSYCA